MPCNECTLINGCYCVQVQVTSGRTLVLDKVIPVELVGLGSSNMISPYILAGSYQAKLASQSPDATLNHPMAKTASRPCLITHSHSHTHILTISCTCCYDEIKGIQDLMIYSHADSLILFPSCKCVCVAMRRRAVGQSMSLSPSDSLSRTSMLLLAACLVGSVQSIHR